MSDSPPLPISTSPSEADIDDFFKPKCEEINELFRGKDLAFQVSIDFFKSTDIHTLELSSVDSKTIALIRYIVTTIHTFTKEKRRFVPHFKLSTSGTLRLLYVIGPKPFIEFIQKTFKGLFEDPKNVVMFNLIININDSTEAECYLHSETFANARAKTWYHINLYETREGKKHYVGRKTAFNITFDTVAKGLKRAAAGFFYNRKYVPFSIVGTKYYRKVFNLIEEENKNYVEQQMKDLGLDNEFTSYHYSITNKTIWILSVIPIRDDIYFTGQLTTNKKIQISNLFKKTDTKLAELNEKRKEHEYRPLRKQYYVTGTFDKSAITSSLVKNGIANDQQIQFATNQYPTLKSTNQELKDQLKEKEKEIQKKDEIISKMQEQIEKLNNETKEMDQIKQMMVKLESMVHTLDHKISELQNENKIMKEVINDTPNLKQQFEIRLAKADQAPMDTKTTVSKRSAAEADVEYNKKSKKQKSDSPQCGESGQQ